MLKRYTKDNIQVLLRKLGERANNIPAKVLETVNGVIAAVRKDGDAALKKFTLDFDGVALDSLYLTESEAEEALAKLPDGLYETMERAAANIRAFHEKQREEGFISARPGRVTGQRVLPLRRVGMYVPGGTAAYPSSVLMNAIPAKVAGVAELIMATPPKKEGLNPAVVAAAKIAGVDKILLAGGAQVIAALAYGTESVKKVDKIVGPGNDYVATAKRLVYGAVDIDMIAGPSEVLIIADETADPAYVAADLMSQAEHDPRAAAVLITTDEKLADKVDEELKRQIALLPRAETIKKSLGEFGAVVILDSIDEAVALSNEIAPEHLELSIADSFSKLGLVENAGSVFLGHDTPEPLGDYYAGPNHVLPTNGTARFASALSVSSFVKRSSYLCYDRASLLEDADDVIRFAEAEGLGAHANSIRQRLNKDENA
ncbi:MAG TPA: histidinol dehydrogenase [Clostridiales bacterium]|jgi:histidinol dehydrogenase|nr:histidinol dehydrogenase [Clostridiales bacterium]